MEVPDREFRTLQLVCDALQALFHGVVLTAETVKRLRDCEDLRAFVCVYAPILYPSGEAFVLDPQQEGKRMLNDAVRDFSKVDNMICYFLLPLVDLLDESDLEAMFNKSLDCTDTTAIANRILQVYDATGDAESSTVPLMLESPPKKTKSSASP